MSEKADVYSRVTDKIIADLESKHSRFRQRIDGLLWPSFFRPTHYKGFCLGSMPVMDWISGRSRLTFSSGTGADLTLTRAEALSAKLYWSTLTGWRSISRTYPS
jgi:hypothetical protein